MANEQASQAATDQAYVDAATALVEANLIEEEAAEEAAAVLATALAIEDQAIQEAEEAVAAAEAVKAAAALEVVQVLMAAEQIEEAAAEDVVETLVAAEIIKEEAADEVADTLATAKAVKEAAAQDVVQTLVAAELIEQAAAAEATQALVEAEIVKESAAEEAVDTLIAADIIEEDAAQDAVKAIQSSKKDEIQALYVQSAHSVTYRDGVLNLNGLAPNTLYFSDRPDRVVGHVTTEEFLNAWGEGDDSFAADPPNANLSILSETDITNVVVELTNPAMTGEGMSYSVEILEGDLPASGGPSALFIDTIGRPLSPVSVGGMHRRTRRRTRRRMRR